MDLFHCPVCLFQTGQADGPYSLSRLSNHVLVRPLEKQSSIGVRSGLFDLNQLALNELVADTDDILFQAMHNNNNICIAH